MAYWLDHPIVELIRKSVNPHPKPAVYISGGIDSSILLHHVLEKVQDEVYTYTYAFFEDDNEFEEAGNVADYYGTTHKEVLIKPFIGRFPEILTHFDRPRFNLQTYWVAEKASKDGRGSAYIGEGLDEHFGGYWYKTDKNYIESWVDHFQFIRTTHLKNHEIFDLRCEIPFTYLPIEETLPYWDPTREKTHLRNAYRDILPDFVIERRKMPGRPTWRKLWERELCQLYPHIQPKTDEEIRVLLNRYATGVWLAVHP